MSAELGRFTEELSGYPNVSYVEQPPKSEQCFAAIVSAVSGAQLHESQAALYQGGFVEEDGGTGLFWMETELEAAGTQVNIDLLDPPENPHVVLALLEEQFKQGKAVALMYKKTGDIEDDRYHWILLNGSRSDGAIHVMDPLRDPEELEPESGEEMYYVARGRIMELIKQSTDYREASDGEIKAKGIFPHTITTSAGPSAGPIELLVVPKFDQEPEPIEDTYTVTKQGDIKPGAAE